mgnify:CR=1 FL=1
MKTFKYYLLLWGILLALFHLVAFVAPTEKDGVFWVTYGAVMLTLIGNLICAFLAFKEENRQKLFYHIPLITISYLGLAALILVGGVCTAVPGVPVWVAIIACALILGVNAICMVSAKAAAGWVAHTDDKIKAQTAFIKSLAIDAETLMAEAESPEIKAELKKACEAIRYSDPISNDSLRNIEAQITEQFAHLSKAVASCDVTAVQKDVAALTGFVAERNRKCRLAK